MPETLFEAVDNGLDLDPTCPGCGTTDAYVVADPDCPDVEDSLNPLCGARAPGYGRFGRPINQKGNNIYWAWSLLRCREHECQSIFDPKVVK